MHRLMTALIALCCFGWSNLWAEDTDKRAVVRLETTAGNIDIALYNATPQHRDNFLKLTREGYYNGTLFHRVIENFMIQGGDPTSRQASAETLLGEGGPDYTLPAEIATPHIYHKRGAVAAARQGDAVNPERRSSGSQFYIVWGQTFSNEQLNRLARTIERSTGGTTRLTPEMRAKYTEVGGTPHLDGQYTVFGEVIAGLDIVNDIQQYPTDTNDRPVRNVVITRAIVLKELPVVAK